MAVFEVTLYGRFWVTPEAQISVQCRRIANLYRRPPTNLLQGMGPRNFHF
jgi:hypothetical protein